MTTQDESAAYRLLWWALGILLITRLALIFGFDVAQTSDAAWYHERAVEMARTGRYAENGVSTAFWPVGYPAFLGALTWLFGESPRVGQLANLALSAMTLWMLHHWCIRRFAAPRIAGVAALMLAVYPNHMGYSVALYSEPLYTVLLLAVLLAVDASARWPRWLLAGVLCGLASLVKPQTLLLAPPLLFVMMLAELRPAALRCAVGATLVALGAMAATIAPWTCRNLVTMGAPVLISTNGGMSLLIANNDQVRWGQKESYTHDGPVFDRMRFSVEDQVTADRRARALVREWIAAHPERFVGLMPWKAYRLWAHDGESEWYFQRGYPRYEDQRLWFRALRVANQAYYAALLLAGIWVLLRNPRWRHPDQWAVPVVLLYFTLLSMVFSGPSRYHAPLMPLVIAHAALAWVAWRTRSGLVPLWLRPSSSRPSPPR